MRAPKLAVFAVTIALLSAASAHAETITHTGTGGAVPDGDGTGVSFDIAIPDPRLIPATGNNVSLTLTDVSTPADGWGDPFGGLVDFAVTLEHVGSGAPEPVFVNVLDQWTIICVAGLDGTYTFRSGEPNTLQAQCGNAVVPPGAYLATEGDDVTDSGLSSAWNGQPAAGTWRLKITDTNINTGDDQFVLDSDWTWSLDIEVEDPIVSNDPPATPGPPAATPKPTCKGKQATITGSGDIRGTSGPDVIVGSAGDDRIEGGRGADLVCAGDGRDRVLGGGGADRLFGEAGDDRMSGGAGNDSVSGGAGNDRLLEPEDSGKGEDRLSGGSGRDRIVTNGSQGDRVDCGLGRYSAKVDEHDSVRRCERVTGRD